MDSERELMKARMLAEKTIGLFFEDWKTQLNNTLLEIKEVEEHL